VLEELARSEDQPERGGVSAAAGPGLSPGHPLWPVRSSATAQALLEPLTRKRMAQFHRRRYPGPRTAAWHGRCGRGAGAGSAMWPPVPGPLRRRQRSDRGCRAVHPFKPAPESGRTRPRPNHGLKAAPRRVLMVWEFPAAAEFSTPLARRRTCCTPCWLRASAVGWCNELREDLKESVESIDPGISILSCWRPAAWPSGLEAVFEAEQPTRLKPRSPGARDSRSAPHRAGTGAPQRRLVSNRLSARLESASSWLA